MATDDCAVKQVRHYTKSPNFGVNFRYEKFTGAAYLLLFGLYEGSRHLVTQDNTLGMQFNARTFIDFKIVNSDKFLSLPHHLP